MTQWKHAHLQFRYDDRFRQPMIGYLLLVVSIVLTSSNVARADAAQALKVAVFQADVTPPPGVVAGVSFPHTAQNKEG